MHLLLFVKLGSNHQTHVAPVMVSGMQQTGLQVVLYEHPLADAFAPMS